MLHFLLYLLLVMQKMAFYNRYSIPVASSTYNRYRYINLKCNVDFRFLCCLSVAIFFRFFLYHDKKFMLDSSVYID